MSIGRLGETAPRAGSVRQTGDDGSTEPGPKNKKQVVLIEWPQATRVGGFWRVLGGFINTIIGLAHDSGLESESPLKSEPIIPIINFYKIA